MSGVRNSTPAEIGRKTSHQCRRGFIGTCGWGRRRIGLIIPVIFRSTGGAGGDSAGGPPPPKPVLFTPPPPWRPHCRPPAVSHPPHAPLPPPRPDGPHRLVFY